MKLKISYETNADWLREVAGIANSKTSVITVMIDLKNNIVNTKNYYPIELLSEMIDEAIVPKPDYEISSVLTSTHKIIKIKVYKGENGPYYFVEKDKNRLYVKRNDELVELELDNFIKLLPNDIEYKTLDYKYTYGNFNYFEKKYNMAFKKNPDFSKSLLLKDDYLTYTGYCLSESVNNFIVVTCRKYKGTHIFSKIRRAVFVDLYMGDLISILEKTLKFVKDFNHIQYVNVDGYPTQIRDYSYELFNKAIVKSFLDHDFTKCKEIFVDMYDDKMIICSMNDNNLRDKKLLLGYFNQFNLINIGNYYKDDEKIIRENENYIYDDLSEIYQEEEIDGAIIKIFTNYNYKNLHRIPEDMKSSLGVTHWLDKKVLVLIKENCENTIPYMAHLLRVKESSIKRSVKRLSENGYIRQIGSGYFQIL